MSKKSDLFGGICCPDFKPDNWNEKEIKWKNKFFVKDKVIAFFHIPLNFGMAMKKNAKNIAIAQAKDKEQVVFVDEINPFKSNLYISVARPVVGLNDVKLSGNFLSKVFEGKYSNLKKWMKEMEDFVKSKSKTAKKYYYYYPYCPKCSKKYGKNYVVILAEI